MGMAPSGVGHLSLQPHVSFKHQIQMVVGNFLSRLRRDKQVREIHCPLDLFQAEHGKNRSIL